MNSLLRVYGLDGTTFRRGRADPGSPHTIKGPFYYISTLTIEDRKLTHEYHAIYQPLEEGGFP